ncbi:hypothetical protein C8Q74DRAFT_628907 [Fomes fomentarius]|nr:hypothetical protein C8Q74DRAFT_628907 [Fomes fomentarius]
MRITRYLRGWHNLLFAPSLLPLDVLRLECGLPSVATTAGTFWQKDVSDPIRTTQQGGEATSVSHHANVSGSPVCSASGVHIAHRVDWLVRRPAFYRSADRPWLPNHTGPGRGLSSPARCGAGLGTSLALASVATFCVPTGTWAEACAVATPLPCTSSDTPSPSLIDIGMFLPRPAVARSRRCERTRRRATRAACCRPRGLSLTHAIPRLVRALLAQE